MPIMYQIGQLIADIIITTVILVFVHWVIRKIRRRQRKTVRQWLTSWAAGPELFIFGYLFTWRHMQHLEEGPLIAIFYLIIVCSGVIIFIIKIIASVISRFRHRAPASTPVSSPPVSAPAQPLGRQPPLA
jgi:heme/copper-type cytochrome/quinol oxidase subunit 3